MKTISILILSVLLVSCAGIPDSITPVNDFELDRYLGKWYEIARLDHRFERGLEKVTADYSLKNDGNVRVTNKGFSKNSGKWKDAIGKAKFDGAADVGHLKVSFFGPFYGSYVIFYLDQHYQYSFVTGSENTLWLLSRYPKVSDKVKNKFISMAKDAGYNTDELIFVKQD